MGLRPVEPAVEAAVLVTGVGHPTGSVPVCRGPVRDGRPGRRRGAAPAALIDPPERIQAATRRFRHRPWRAQGPTFPDVAAALLPDLRGLDVVDLGCGFGWFCRRAGAHGTASVLGLDVSANMLARARAMTEDAAITHARADLEPLDLPPAGFGPAYSALVLHCIDDLAGLLAAVHRALSPGGPLVVSMEHAIFTAPTRPGQSVGADGRAGRGAPRAARGT